MMFYKTLLPLCLLLLCNHMNGSEYADTHSDGISLPKIESWKTHKYCGRRLCFYPNSNATFQLLLLLAGDVSLNPGPNDSNIEEQRNVLGELRSNQSTEGATYVYDRASLLALNTVHLHQQRLNPVLWRTLQNLGISRRKKTRRSRRHVLRKTYHDNSTSNSDFSSLLQSEAESNISDDNSVTHDDTYPINVTTRGLRVAHLNIHSLLAKYDHLKEKLVRKPFDILTFSETLLDGTVSDGELRLDGYSLERLDRTRRGGGVAMYISHSLSYTRKHDLELDGLEAIWIEIRLQNSTTIMIGTLYRPPSADAVYQRLIEDSINRAMSLNRELYILGDFNCDMLCKRKSQLILSLCRTHKLKQVIQHPTRITETSTSLIDIVLTNTSHNIVQSCVLSEGLSDHSLVYFVRKLHRPKIEPKTVTFRNFKRFHTQPFLEDLGGSQLGRHFHAQDVNLMWEAWKQMFVESCDRNAPVVTMRVRGQITPWVTEEYIQLSYERDRLKRRAEVSGLSIYWQQFRFCRNHVNNYRHALKKDYYVTNIIEHKRNPAQLWKILKGLSGTNAQPSVDRLRVNDEYIHEPLDIANELNQSFANFGVIPEGAPRHDNGNMHHVSCDQNFAFMDIDSQRVLEILKTLDIKKATGIDGLHSKLLREAAPIVSEQLTQIFNVSLQTGQIPHEWKTAKVTPIFKSGDKHDPNNYRPISVIPIVMKVLERVVHDQLHAHFNDNDLFVKQQSGFRKKHSTNTVLTYFSDYLLKQIDHGRLTGVVYLDLKKAFDSVNHEMLLKKLPFYGVKDRELTWIKSYLSGRTQQTFVNGTLSDTTNVRTGVPQGSIIGPLLFSVMVNDLPGILEKCHIMMYADDTILYYSGDDIKEIESVLNRELETVNKWLTQNHLRLNLSKTQYMVFGSHRKLSSCCDINLTVNNHALERVKFYKYLGVWMDETLTWQKNVEETMKKIGSRLALFSRLRKYLTIDSSKVLTNSLILPYFDYCSNAWSMCAQYLKDGLIRQHKKMARLILQVNFSTPIEQVFHRLKWNSIDERWKFHKCKTVFNILNGEAPVYLSELVVRPSNVHSYRTRNSVQNGVVVPLVRTQSGKKSFSHSAAILWNQLDTGTRCTVSKHSFVTSYWRNRIL